MSALPRRRVLALLGGATVAGALAPAVRAGADGALDLRILQTASSLETLAEAAYAQVPGEALAGFPPAAGRRHAEQRKALQDRTAALGGRAQDASNPKFLPLLAGADRVGTVLTLEKVLVDTYLGNLAVLVDAQAKAVVAAAMAIAAQHLAFLRLAGAVGPQLVRLPFPLADLARLPPAAGTVATPDALHLAGGPDLVADPASGALS